MRFIVSLLLLAFFAAPTLGVALGEDVKLCHSADISDVDRFAKTLARDGYTIVGELDLDDNGCLEARGFDIQGRRIEIWLDPNTGRTVRLNAFARRWSLAQWVLS